MTEFKPLPDIQAIERVKPCPFCGTNLIKNGPFSTRRADCLVHVQDLKGVDYGRCPAAGFRVFSDDPERIAAWNRRALEAKAGENERLRAALIEARDLLLERKQGSPARSAGHSARLVIDRALEGAEIPGIVS